MVDCWGPHGGRSSRIIIDPTHLTPACRAGMIMMRSHAIQLSVLTGRGGGVGFGGMKNLALCVWVVFLVGCGKRYDLGVVVGEVLAKQEAVVAELDGVSDLEGARKAAGRIDELGDELVEIGGKLGSLEDVEEETRLEARVKFLEGMERIRYSVDSGLEGVERDPEVASVLAEALGRFEEKTEEVEERLRGELFR